MATARGFDLAEQHEIPFGLRQVFDRDQLNPKKSHQIEPAIEIRQNVWLPPEEIPLAEVARKSLFCNLKAHRNYRIA